MKSVRKNPVRSAGRGKEISGVPPILYVAQDMKAGEVFRRRI
jgi:hypothetical protein